MPKSSTLKLKTYVIRPDHMQKVARIADTKRLSASALLRLVIGGFVKRNERAAA
jgi:hypothetical protein